VTPCEITVVESAQWEAQIAKRPSRANAYAIVFHASGHVTKASDRKGKQ
jgi:hypothetical protein